MNRDQIKAEYTGPAPTTFETRLDHFNNSEGMANQTFALRYIIDEQYNQNKSGPILFYAGNEGDVEAFYNNSGFMTTTLAQRMNATVVFGEHRYYGESFPFNNRTVAMQRENLKYLSVEQVMMDYVTLLESIKANGSYDQNTQDLNPRTPIYVFGGSYGGMLATWLRMKYPATFHGAIASSAPILWFYGSVDPHAYDQITDYSARLLQNDPNVKDSMCVTVYQRAFYDLIQATNVNSTYENITKEFNVCPDSPITTPQQVEMLAEMVADNIGGMAMVNYPYPTNFLNPLPAWPLNASCNNASFVRSEPQAANETLNFNFENIKKLAAMNFIWQGSDCIFLEPSVTTMEEELELQGALDGRAWEI